MLYIQINFVAVLKVLATILKMYLESSRTSAMDCFHEKSFFAKSFIIDVRLCSKYTLSKVRSLLTFHISVSRAFMKIYRCILYEGISPQMHLLNCSSFVN